MQAYYKWYSSEHHRLFASLWKGKMLSAEVLRAPGSVSPGGGGETITVSSPPHYDRHLTGGDPWGVQEPPGENDRRWRSAPELWSAHGVEEGKGQGGLATSRQYGNALLELRYQEEEEEKVAADVYHRSIGSMQSLRGYARQQ